MSAVRGYAEVAVDLRESADSFERDDWPGCAAQLREAAVLLAGVAAALPEGVTVEQVVAENEALRCLTSGNELASKLVAVMDDERGRVGGQPVTEFLQLLMREDGELAAIHALLPPCPTCGGTGTVRCDSCSGALVSCSDCVDGKVSVEQLVATWQAVHGEQAFVSYPLDDLKGGLLDAFDLGVDRAFAALRSVRPPSPKEGT